MQKYHPSRVLTIVYQPFVFGTQAILAYNEAKISTRIRNLFGYTVVFFGILAVLIVNPVHLFVYFCSSRISIYVLFYFSYLHAIVGFSNIW